jgi:hypothetical protein
MKQLALAFLFALLVALNVASAALAWGGDDGDQCATSIRGWFIDCDND